MLDTQAVIVLIYKLMKSPAEATLRAIVMLRIMREKISSRRDVLEFTR